MIIKHSLPSLDATARNEESRWAASFLKCCSIVYLFICIYREKGKEGGAIVTKNKKMEIMEQGRKNLDNLDYTISVIREETFCAMVNPS